METITAVKKMEIYHRHYNLAGKDNLEELPAEKAVFGVFGIVGGEPVNCRYIGETDNLRKAIQELFDNPPGNGMKRFMQGAWIQMLQYEIMPSASPTEMRKAVEDWTLLHKPLVEEDGEYPGYYDN
jgi:hypothetical protein